MTLNPGAPAATEDLLRRGLVALAGIATAGTAVELAMLRHWEGVAQKIPWVALAVLAVAVVLVARPTAGRVRAARVLAVVVALTGVIGFGQHVLANYDAAPLDFRYTDTWDKLPGYEQWWLAFSETVGPAPPMAPGVLAQAALALGLATLGHPALRRPN